ncbi:MAG TPA: NAD-dependent epimerase/dehydratase family protein [Candidatus Binatia bacterium]|nr:NAD-dependent epimerase/dehydratase family protein [Candidatus Binatia bacterium]
MERLLITGITGGQGRLVAKRVAGDYEIHGVDVGPWEGQPREVKLHQADLRSKRVEDVFRRERPAAVVHLGMVRHRFDPQLRHDVNVVGTKRLLEYCAAYGVKKLVILSSSYVYGALPENPFYMDEDTALNVSRHYPEIRDLAEVDTLATAFLWRYPDIATSILRPVSTLGYYTHSSIGAYLKLRYVPTILGFNPMMQFIHEEDMAEAIARTLETGVRGVFNVVGPGAVPLKVAIRETGGTAVPLLEMAARAAIRRLFRYGFYPLPADAINFAKYPCTIDGRRFREATAFQPLFTLEETLRSVRR